MIYLLSICIAAILAYYLISIRLFTTNLFYNISLANNIEIEDTLKNTNHIEQTYDAVRLHIFWTLIWSPLTLITIILLLLIATTPLEILPTTPEWISLIIPFLIASTITPLITYSKPSWLNEWQYNNELASLLIQLEQITIQLNLVKIQLINIQNKSVILSHNETLLIHNHAKFLIQISQVITDNITQLNN